MMCNAVSFPTWFRMTTNQTWDSDCEDRWFDEVESTVRSLLQYDVNLPQRWILLPEALANLIRSIPGNPPPTFVADAIATSIGLMMASWEKFVSDFSSKLPAEQLLNLLANRPKLERFLEALNLPQTFIQQNPSLARSEMEERVLRGEGCSATEYSMRFGVQLRNPHFRIAAVVTDVADLALSKCQPIPIYGRVMVGRQRKHNAEPPPVSFVEGTEYHRLIIAQMDQSGQCSREQLTIAPLSPNYVFLKNHSSVIPSEIVIPKVVPDFVFGSADSLPEACPPPEVRRLMGEETAVVRIPFSLKLPRKILRFTHNN